MKITLTLHRKNLLYIVSPSGSTSCIPSTASHTLSKSLALIATIICGQSNHPCTHARAHTSLAHTTHPVVVRIVHWLFYELNFDHNNDFVHIFFSWYSQMKSFSQKTSIYKWNWFLKKKKLWKARNYYSNSHRNGKIPISRTIEMCWLSDAEYIPDTFFVCIIIAAKQTFGWWFFLLWEKRKNNSVM